MVWGNGSKTVEGRDGGVSMDGPVVGRKEGDGVSEESETGAGCGSEGHVRDGPGYYGNPG